ncbi:hypothetical protein D9757_012105 [Collybiopsis confluens]|uniref:F-box domain-containing protein n=1 Tax=Collybiopsis confluens TaxID=2823264 RepID=A0A8H5D3K4_9AGAR|nr:hypothetical protein D9757_012105 [Collybiopsis confluens]
MAEASFLHLLSTNFPATDLEIPGVLTAILETERRLRLLEKQFDDLGVNAIDGGAYVADSFVPTQADEISTQLLRSQKEVRDQLLQLHSTLSPLRRLPPEILGLVFSLALPGKGGIQMDNTFVLWRASQVCRLWREILCEGTPHIWSSIEIDCMNTEKSSMTSTLLQLALRRSGTRPLSIRFRFSRRNPFGVLTEMEESCLDLLTKESFRWRELELIYIPIAALARLNASIRNRLPLLCRLIVEDVPASLASDTPSTAEAFGVAPRLEHFSLSGFFRPLRFRLPWSQLVSYTGSFRDLRDFFDVLACADNLTTCDVFLRNFHPGSIIEHSNLQTLRIRGALGGLARIRAPFLQVLVLDELIIQDLVVVSAFIRRTTSIETLELHIPHETGGRDSHDIIYEFMVACRNVSSLKLTGEIDICTICSLLNLSDVLTSSRALIPRLAHLSLSLPPVTDAERVHLLGTMIESRLDPILDDFDGELAPLLSLTLHVSRTAPEVIERLQPLEVSSRLKVIVVTTVI